MNHARQAARHRDPASGQSGATEQQSSGVGNHAAQGQQGGGPLGWFRDAGSWIGDKIGSATDAVGEWAGETKQAAKDLWDVATSTSIGLADGSVYVETDLDELADLMSPETRAALAFDRATADNRIRVNYDRASGKLVATSDELTLTGVQTAKVQTGAVTLRGVRAEFTSQDGKPPSLTQGFSLLAFKDQAGSLNVTVTIADAQAADVVFAGPNGQTEVASVKLTGLTGTVGADGGMPFADAGTTEVDFALEHAVLEGLSADGHAMASAEASGVSGGMSGANESAFLAADSVSLGSVTSGGQQVVGESSMSGLRVDVDNKGGGLLGVDGKADQARARVAVEAARVSQLDTDDFDAAGLSASQLSGSFDTTTGMASASASSLAVNGLDTSWVDATRLQADQLSLAGDLRGADGRRDVELDVGKLSGNGLSVVAQDDTSSAPGMGGMPLDWSADIDAVDIADAQAGGASIDRVTLAQAGVSGVIDGEASNYAAEARHTELSGFAHEQMTADRLATTNTSLSGDASRTGFTADHVEAHNLDTGNLRAAELHAFGGTASLGGEQARATLERARMLDATVAGRVDIQEANVDQLYAHSDSSGKSVAAAGGQVIGVSDRESGASLGTASFQQADLAIDGNGATASLDQASLTDAQGFGASLSSGSVEGLSASRSGGVDQVGIKAVSAAGLSYGDNRAAHLHAGGIQGHRDADGMRATAERASGRQLQIGDTASVATAGFTDLAASQDASGAQATIGSSALAGIGFNTATAEGRIHSMDVQGARAGRDASGQQYAGADGLNMRDLQASGRTSSADPSSALSELDLARLVETSSAQLRHADVSASAMMAGGDLGLGGLWAEPDTRVDIGMSVRQGEIMDEGTYATFDGPLDSPLWTSVRGAYVDDGRVRGDVAGWFDQDITSDLTDSLGMGGDRLPSVAGLGSGMADYMRLSGAGGSTDISSFIDVDSIRSDGTARLGDGVIESGVGRVDLAASERNSDNRIDFKTGDGSLEAQIQRFLADSASLSSGGLSAAAHDLSVSGASVDANSDGWNLKADELNASDLSSSRQ